MPFAAVLDASVLYPLPLRNTLLRVAETELFYEAVERQAGALSRPPMSLDALLDRLAVTVPDFAKTLREHG